MMTFIHTYSFTQQTVTVWSHESIILFLNDYTKWRTVGNKKSNSLLISMKNIFAMLSSHDYNGKYSKSEFSTLNWRRRSKKEKWKDFWLLKFYFGSVEEDEEEGE